MNTALRLLLLLSLGGTVMGLVLMGLRKLLGKRLPSAVYYYAWLLVLVRLVLPLPGLVPMGAEEPAEAPVKAASAPVRAAEADPWSPMDRVWAEERMDWYAAETGAAVYAEPETPVESAAAVTEETASASETVKKNPIPWARYMDYLKEILARPVFWMVIWGLGTAFCAGGCIVGYVRFYRALKETFRPANESDRQIYDGIYGGAKPTLVRSCCVKTPMLMGLRKPVLILPNRIYAPRMLESILRHELTHYHRMDLLYKWFAAAVFALHWFNPFMGLFRRELDRLCELSCDEFILREMTQEEKQNYGETLLSLAAIRSLPRSVVATTFATEKRTLKERLEQIMTYKHGGKKTIALALAILLLFSGCGMVMGPEAANIGKNDTAGVATLSADPVAQPTPEPIPVEMASPEQEEVQEVVYVDAPAGGETVTVSTVDEFLAAIAPNNTIILEPGEYILSDAETYGKKVEGGWYTWDKAYLYGYQLNIHDISGLTILGGGEATICTDPRGVEVLAFHGCSDIAITGTVVGHTEMPAVCQGGVLYFNSCEDVTVTECGLYGCGTWGITAVNSRNIHAVDTDIYDCSHGAVWLQSCQNFRLEGGSVYDCGEMAVNGVFRAENCYGVAVMNTEIYDNMNSELVFSDYSDQIYILGSAVRNNTFEYMFNCMGYSPIVNGCVFENNSVEKYVLYMSAVTLEGAELTLSDLESMTQVYCEYLMELNPPTVVEKLEKTLREDGTSEVWVSTVDELLAAIAPDTLVHLAAGDYNLADATGYGNQGGQYYYWTGVYDGPQLIITGVENFHLVGEGKDATKILAEPRYAEVIAFNACRNITLAELTAGHTQAPSTCAGGVIKFQDTEVALINNCGLFGCGILGVTATGCADIQVLNTEIYECSYGAASVSSSRNVSFDNCDIHDCGAPIFSVSGSCANVTLNGENIVGMDGIEYVYEEKAVAEILAQYGEFTITELPAELTQESASVETAEFGDSRRISIKKEFFSKNDWNSLALTYVVTEGTAFTSAREEYENALSSYAGDACTVNGCEGLASKWRIFWFDEEADVFYRIERYRGSEDTWNADELIAMAESVQRVN